jgi:hypothetical protein
MAEFREALADCIGFSGNPWTFDNRQRGDRNVRVCLDRAVASMSWSAFTNAKLQHLTSSRSDHAPILLMLDREDGEQRPRCSRHYEIMWEREPSLPDAVKSA